MCSREVLAKHLACSPQKTVFRASPSALSFPMTFGHRHRVSTYNVEAAATGLIPPSRQKTVFIE